MRNVILAVLLLAARSSFCAEEPWKPISIPLKTRWSDVSVREPRHEYPRPEIARNIDRCFLNGLWEFAIAPIDAQQPAEYKGKILVPFPAESACSGVMKSIAANERLWYRFGMEIPKHWNQKWMTSVGRRLRLHIGAIAGESKAFLNGKELGSHHCSYDRVMFDITDALKNNGIGPQEFVLSVVPREHAVGNTACTGIWQSVWLESVPKERVDALQIVSDVDAGVLRLTVAGKVTEEKDRVEAVVSDRGSEVARVSGKIGEELSLRIPNARLWSPESPYLYDLKVEVKRDKTTLDSITSYFGMRKMSVGKSEKNAARVLLNGKEYFEIGVSDGGWWPDGVSTAPSLAALQAEIETVKQLGFNTIWKTGKVEEPQWYYLCDRLGVAVWQDISENVARNDEEVRAIVESLKNHPCVILWSAHGKAKTKEEDAHLAALIKQLDPTRLFLGASSIAITDLNANPNTATTIASFVGPVPNSPKANAGQPWLTAGSPNDVLSAQEFNNQFIERTQLATQARADGQSGVFFAQLTDGPDNHLGLMSANRALIKLDLDLLAALPKTLPLTPQIKQVVPTGRTGSGTWHYTGVKPAADWASMNFDATSWKSGPGPFAENAAPGTDWKEKEIWLRREFELSDAKLLNPFLMARRTGEFEVFINGVAAAQSTGAGLDYERIRIAKIAFHALKTGKNILAVHYRTPSEKGQYVDVGLVDVIPQRDMRFPASIRPEMDSIWMRDPCVCLGPDGIYYLVGTGGTTSDWNCDDLPLFKSPDLKNWEFVKMVWSPKRDATWQLKGRDKAGVWAPEIHYIKENYWITYCISYPPTPEGIVGTGLLKSLSGKPEGPYTDVKPDGPMSRGLDASLFEDDDGKVYFLYGGSTIARMKDDMSGLVENFRELHTEAGGRIGFEGVYMFKANGRYYLSATDATLPDESYDCMVAVSDSVYGPFKKLQLGLKFGGHNMFFKDKEDRWFCTIFSFPEDLFNQKFGIVRIEFAPDGSIHPLDARR